MCIRDRLGANEQYTNILGVDVPFLTIPIKPGRNLAVILEVAAMNNRQKKMGYNSAKEFTDRINHHFEQQMAGGMICLLYTSINYVSDQSAMRITTGMLNNVLADATARVQPPTDKGRRLKVYYMTQTGVKPPCFVCFCNDAKLFHFSYQPVSYTHLDVYKRQVLGQLLEKE